MTPIVYADAGTQPKNATVDGDAASSSTSDDESLAEDQQVKKKSKREKVGFRDRKVKSEQINSIENEAESKIQIRKLNHSYFWLFKKNSTSVVLLFIYFLFLSMI